MLLKALLVERGWELEAIMKPFQVPLIGQKQLTVDLPSGKKKAASRTAETGQPPLPFSLALHTDLLNSSFWLQSTMLTLLCDSCGCK